MGLQEVGHLAFFSKGLGRKEVTTCVRLVSPFLDTTGVFMMRIFCPFKNTVRVWVIEDIFVFDAVQVYVPCKNFHTLSNSTLVSIWYLHGINPNNVVGLQRCYIKYQYLMGIIILIQVG